MILEIQFTDDSSDLYVIDTKDVKGKDVAKSITLRTLEHNNLEHIMIKD